MTRTTEPQQWPDYHDTQHKTTLNFHMIQHDEIQPGDQFGYKIIMTVDKFRKTWWATRGLTSWSDGYVRDHGDKISQEAAEELFPMMPHLGYTYRD